MRKFRSALYSIVFVDFRLAVRSLVIVLQFLLRNFGVWASWKVLHRTISDSVIAVPEASFLTANFTGLLSLVGQAWGFRALPESQRI